MNATVGDRFYAEGVARMAHYRGLPMICVEGLHEQVAEEARRLLPAGARVLDVGCGRGAFALRMADLGFEVEACDLRDHCMCKDRVRFIKGSAESLEPTRTYDAIFMLELLEHLEDPFGVMRKYLSALSPGGHLVVSTPNVDSALSRAWFLLTGRHWYFDHHNVEGDGHITPIHGFQMEAFLRGAEVKWVDRIAGPEQRKVRPGLLWALRKLAHVRSRDSKAREGASTIYVLRRPA